MSTGFSTIERLLEILQRVATTSMPISAQETAAELGIPVSTLYRHLGMLDRWGLVQKTDVTGKYSAGPLCLQLAMNFHRHNTLSIQARPELLRLAKASNETVALMVATQRQVICIDMIESSQALRCAFSSGVGQPLIRGASSLALLAFMPTAQRINTIDTLVPKQEQETIEQTLKEVRSQGFAESCGAIDAGVWGVSVPLLRSGNKLLGALTLMAPSERALNKRILLIQQTRHAARTISEYVSVN